MVTPEDATNIFKKYKVSENIDFLSVDIDGNDFWVTNAILEGGYRPAVLSV